MSVDLRYACLSISRQEDPCPGSRALVWALNYFMEKLASSEYRSHCCLSRPSDYFSYQRADLSYGSLARPPEGQKQSPRYVLLSKPEHAHINISPAPQQISAEQLLREAVDRQEPGLQAPTQRFADLEELHEFQGRKRKEFEDYVRRNRINMNNWMRLVCA